MRKNKNGNLCNMTGKNIKTERINMKMSQRKLAEQCQLKGLNIGKNRISDIECGKAFISDIELIKIAESLQKTPNDLYKIK